MKSFIQLFFVVVLLAPACKRSELELNDTNGVQLPGSGDITSARSIEDERTANKKRQADLDQTITTLKSSLINSKNLSAGQRESLESKIKSAQDEKTALAAREKELEDKLTATEKALNEARTRNEELKKELEKAKTDTKTTTNGQDTTPAVQTLGPFTLFHDTYCLAVKDKSLQDNATLLPELCAANSPQQVFMFELADETSGAYRIRNVNSQKCLKIADGSIDVGAKLMQGTCNSTDFSEQFYILGLTDDIFLLQSAKSQYCMNRQTDDTFAQVVCDSKLESNFEIGKSKT